MLVNSIVKQTEIRAMLEEIVRLGTQSLAIPATTYEPAPPSQRGTRMPRIGRIFTDLCASVSSVASVLYRIPSAFICVHLRLIFVSLSDRTRKIQFILSHIIIKSGSVSVQSGILRGRMSSRHV